MIIYILIGSRKNSPWSHGRSDRKLYGIPCPRSRFFVIFAMKVFFLGVVQKPPPLLLLLVQLRHPPTFFFCFSWVLNLIGIQTLAHKTLLNSKVTEMHAGVWRLFTFQLVGVMEGSIYMQRKWRS